MLRKAFAEVADQCPTTLGDFLRFEIVNDLVRVYPNFVRRLRISVRSAEAERLFTRLQLLKTNLRSKMSDQRLSLLAVMISLNRDLAKKFDYISHLKLCQN